MNKVAYGLGLAASASVACACAISSSTPGITAIAIALSLVSALKHYKPQNQNRATLMDNLWHQAPGLVMGLAGVVGGGLLIVFGLGVMAEVVRCAAQKRESRIVESAVGLGQTAIFSALLPTLSLAQVATRSAVITWRRLNQREAATGYSSGRRLGSKA